MEYHLKRRQCAHFFGELCKKAVDGFLVYSFSGSVALECINDFLTIGLFSATLLGALPQEICPTDGRCRSALWRRGGHFHLRLSSAKPCTGFRRSLAFCAASLAVIKLFAAATFKPVAPTSARPLSSTSGIRSEAGFGCARTRSYCG